MKYEEFREWLDGQSENKRLNSNAVSRAKRVEKEMKNVNSRFSYEKEYKKDKGESFVRMVEKKGVTLPNGVNLPKGTDQMYCIAFAVRKVFQFLSKTQE